MRKIFFIVVLISFNVQAQDIFSMSMDEFYQIDDNQKMYDTMLELGQIEKARESYKSLCKKEAKSDEENAKCDCASNLIDEVDGKMLMYDAVMAFKSFQAKAAAKKAGDKNEYERLEQLDAKRQGITNIIGERCS